MDCHFETASFSARSYNDNLLGRPLHLDFHLIYDQLIDPSNPGMNEPEPNSSE